MRVEYLSVHGLVSTFETGSVGWLFRPLRLTAPDYLNYSRLVKIILFGDYTRHELYNYQW